MEACNELNVAESAAALKGEPSPQSTLTGVTESAQATIGSKRALVAAHTQPRKNRFIPRLLVATENRQHHYHI
jgi:hypothetical protein